MVAPNGMMMMLKTFGLDPEVLVKGAEEFKAVAVNAQNAVIAIQQRLDVMEKQMIDIAQKLDLLLQNPVLNQPLDMNALRCLETAGQQRIFDVSGSMHTYATHEDELVETELVNAR